MLSTTTPAPVTRPTTQRDQDHTQRVSFFLLFLRIQVFFNSGDSGSRGQNHNCRTTWCSQSTGEFRILKESKNWLVNYFSHSMSTKEVREMDERRFANNKIILIQHTIPLNMNLFGLLFLPNLFSQSLPSLSFSFLTNWTLERSMPGPHPPLRKVLSFYRLLTTSLPRSSKHLQWRKWSTINYPMELSRMRKRRWFKVVSFEH